MQVHDLHETQEPKGRPLAPVAHPIDWRIQRDGLP